MNLVFLLSIVIISVSAAPPPAQRKVEDKPPVTVIESTFEKSPDGSYTYRFELSDGYLKEEKGVAVNPGEENSPVDVTGFYKYIDENGEPVEVHYSANQFGFVPEGTNIEPEITSNARSAVEAKTKELQG